MPDIFKGLTDITMTLDGDLAVAGDGDLAISEGFDWLSREVNKRIRTNNPDWMYHPTIGASLEFYIGLQNTEAVARRIRQAIDRSLDIDDIGFPGSWDIQVFPIGRETLGIIINLNLIGIRVTLERFIYNYDNGVVQPITDQLDFKESRLPVDVKPIDVSKLPPPKHPNKYQTIINSQDRRGY